MAWPALLRLAVLGVLCGFAGAALALEINLASEAELDSVRGMGPAMSRAILAERQRKPFSDWADLMRRVKGIRSASAERFDEVTASARRRPDCRCGRAEARSTTRNCTWPPTTSLSAGGLLL